MFSKRKEVILLVFGKGGHNAQITRYIDNDNINALPFIALTSAETIHQKIEDKFFCIEARDKFSQLKNLFVFCAYIFVSCVQMVRIIFRYKVVAMISTGPGLAVIPGIICRLKRAKVIYFESWSRIEKPSLAGRFMYWISNQFFVQHKSMKARYPKAKYMGRL